VPSLCPKTSQGIDEEGEGVTIELPEYDLRRLITARDPLCCLQAFLVMARVLFPNLYGFRMCPRCPHCVKSRFPCIDRFGSNATPTGGAAGRADAMVGAVEAQQAEGVLHLHLVLFLQGASQYATLQELAEMFAKRALDIDAVKAFHSYVRCAEAPDVAKMEAEQDVIERTWPAFAEDQSLCRIPEELWNMGRRAPAEHPWARPNDDAAREQLPPAAASASSNDIPHPVSFGANNQPNSAGVRSTRASVATVFQSARSFLATSLERVQDTWANDGKTWRECYERRVQHTFSRMDHHIYPLNEATGERRVLKSCKPQGTGQNV
jgi:hypothetical protein